VPSRTLAPDQSVLQSLASGDAEAVRELFRRHSGSLYALAYGLLMDSTDADRVVEETFELVTRHAAEFNPTLGAVGSWLAGIARTHAQGLAVVRRKARTSRSFPSRATNREPLGLGA